MKLRFYPDPIFKQQAQEIKEFGQETKELGQIFIAALKEYNALGLGANMLGILKRAIIVSDGNLSPIFMINPKITPLTNEKELDTEASLSIPGISLKIPRYKEIKTQYQDISGQHITLESSKLLARVIQHETDYLDGITIFDHLSPVKKMLALEKYKKHIK